MRIQPLCQECPKLWIAEAHVFSKASITVILLCYFPSQQLVATAKKEIIR